VLTSSKKQQALRTQRLYDSATAYRIGETKIAELQIASKTSCEHSSR